jgi:hypothetical protein
VRIALGKGDLDAGIAEAAVDFLMKLAGDLQPTIASFTKTRSSKSREISSFNLHGSRFYSLKRSTPNVQLPKSTTTVILFDVRC